MIRFLWRLTGGQSYPQARRPGVAGQRRWARWRRARSAGPDPSEPDGFEGYVRHFQLTEAELRRLHRHHALQCYGWFGGALFALGFGVTTAVLTEGALLGLSTCWLGWLLLAAAAGSSLRAWQLRERRLGSFGEWTHRPREWFPSLFS